MIKRTTISLRIDKKTKDKLQALEDKSGMSKSDVVRQGIKMMYEEYLSDDTTNYTGSGVSYYNRENNK